MKYLVGPMNRAAISYSDQWHINHAEIARMQTTEALDAAIVIGRENKSFVLIWSRVNSCVVTIVCDAITADILAALEIGAVASDYHLGHKARTVDQDKIRQDLQDRQETAQFWTRVVYGLFLHFESSSEWKRMRRAKFTAGSSLHSVGTVDEISRPS